MLTFKPISLEDKEKVEGYFYKYGEGSCQHSFVSSYCLFSKYGDMICEKNDVLYILRSGRCTEKERVYLFPMMDIACEQRVREAVEEILRDAHEYGKTVRFETLTEKAKNRLIDLFPGHFIAKTLRDYAEYIYTFDKLANLPGHETASKRYDLRTFFRDYGDRTMIEIIRPDHLEDIIEFQKYWLTTHKYKNIQLEQENKSIQLGLSHFSELGLSGIVIYIAGKLCGYAYGAPLSETCYDVLIEKGDTAIPDIYRVLNRELVRLCCQGYEYINREEDVGNGGLRKSKLSYRPDILLEKFLVREDGWHE